MKKPLATHERLVGGEKIERSSDRSFGIVFTAVFTVIGLWPLIDEGGVRLWSLGLALVVGMVTLVRRSALAPLNRVWTKIGTPSSTIIGPSLKSHLGNFG